MIQGTVPDILHCEDVLIYSFQKKTCNHPLLHVQCIWQIFLFQEYCYFSAIDFQWTVIISGGHFRFLFRILHFFETSTCRHPFFLRNSLICHTSCSHPFLERPLFSYKIAVLAMRSFKFIYSITPINSVAAIHYIKRTWFTSRTFTGYCVYLRKGIAAPLF